MKVKVVTDRRNINEKLMHGAGGWNGRPLDILWAMQGAKGAPDHAFVIPNRMYFNARSDEMSTIFDPTTDPSVRREMIENGHKIYHYSSFAVPFTGIVIYKEFPSGKEPAAAVEVDGTGKHKRKRESLDGALRRAETERRNAGVGAFGLPSTVFTLHEIAHHSLVLTDLLF